MPKNNLTFYLLRDSFVNEEQYINLEKVEKKIPITSNISLYVGASIFNTPKWVTNFFGNQPTELNEITGRYPKAVLIVSATTSQGNKKFAIPFGYGRSLLRTDVWEERFGLKLSLNLLRPDKVKKMNKKSLDSMNKLTVEQLGQSGGLPEFGIDIEKDMLEAVVGESKDLYFGFVIAGKDTFHTTVDVDINNIENFLTKCYEKYLSKEYESDFKWVDQIEPLNSKQKIDKLDELLVEKINRNDLESIWLAVPDIIPWEQSAGFKYSHKMGADSQDDLILSYFLTTIEEEISIDMLKEIKAICIDAASEQELINWTVYKCMYAELKIQNEDCIYILSNGKWYRINTDFVSEVEQSYKTIPISDIKPIPFNHDKESDYNTEFVKKSAGDSLFCDGKNIMHGGGNNRIEFCDIYTHNKQLLHVKKYSGSSVLSHLFNQAVVSAELLAGDASFRQKLNTDLLSGSFSLEDPLARPKINEFEIIFGIISNSSKPLNIPFFSKVSLRKASKSLKAMGYENIKLLKIDNIKK